MVELVNFLWGACELGLDFLLEPYDWLHSLERLQGLLLLCFVNDLHETALEDS